jgi:hypothetical protein
LKIEARWANFRWGKICKDLQQEKVVFLFSRNHIFVDQSQIKEKVMKELKLRGCSQKKSISTTY